MGDLLRRHPVSLLLALGASIVSNSSYYLLLYVPTYGIKTLHPPAYTGFVATLVGGLATFSVVAGYWSDKIRPRARICSSAGLLPDGDGAAQHHGADGDRAACASCRELMKGVRDPSSHRRIARPSSARELNRSCGDKRGSARNSAGADRNGVCRSISTNGCGTRAMIGCPAFRSQQSRPALSFQSASISPQMSRGQAWRHRSESIAPQARSRRQHATSERLP